MKVRCVVTGKDGNGTSKVLSDGPSPGEVALQHMPGFVSSPLWMVNETPDLSNDRGRPIALTENVLAPVGGAAFMVVTFPPDSIMAAPDFDPEKAGAEFASAAPGLAEKFELDHPGMHTTQTVDFATVVKGQIVLEVDNGVTVQLKAGDTVVQLGTRHAWRNPGDESAVVSFVMLGAKA